MREPTEQGADWVSLAQNTLSTASLHEAAGRKGALPAWIKPLAPHLRLSGPAYPVKSPPGDNLFLHHAIYRARPGDVLVVDAGACPEYGHWGDIMAMAAQVRGLTGLVITGGVRDSQQLVAMGFPTFAGCVSIRGTGKNPEGDGSLGEPIRIGSVDVREGDLVVGDGDGVVVLPAAQADAIVARARRRDLEEERISVRLRAGETTLSIYGLPDIATGAGMPPARRRSVHVPGLGHGDLPIPAASRVGNVIATGGVRGVDPRTGEMPEAADEQARLMFDNLRRVVEAAGASVEDILKVTVWIADPAARPAINPPWVAMFPDPESRPARHVLRYDLPSGMAVQCDAIVVAP